MPETQRSGSDNLVGVWMSIAALADRKGVKRQSMHQRVSKLAKEGLIEIRKDGRNRLVDLAAYDMAVGQTGDAFREQGAATKREAEAPAADRAPMRDAQLVGLMYSNSKLAIEVGKLRGELLPVKGPRGLEAAILKSAEAIIRAINKIPMSRIADIEAAARIDTAHLRRVIRAMINEMRGVVAEALQQIVAADVAAGDYEIELDDPT